MWDGMFGSLEWRLSISVKYMWIDGFIGLEGDDLRLPESLAPNWEVRADQFVNKAGDETQELAAGYAEYEPGRTLKAI